MAQADKQRRWFSIPIEVRGIHPDSEFVLLSCHINFSHIIRNFGENGIVDERSLILHHISPDGQEIDESFQFTSDPQKRYPEKSLTDETPETVSWVAEFPTRYDPASYNVDLIPQVAGTLTWTACGAHGGASRYELLFAIPQDGVNVQVPFPMSNLRHFNADGRPTPVRWFPRMKIRPQWTLDGTIHILDDESLITSYHLGPNITQPVIFPTEARRPYFYPVNSPDGFGLTELGKPHDPTGSHAHHYSLWIAHANVGGSDFWSEKGGTIRHVQFELMEDGALFARLIQQTRWVIKDETLIAERRQINVYKTPNNFRIIDLELELSSGNDAPVELGKTPFGFLSARVAQSMTVFDGSGEILNSQGQRNEQGAFWQNAQWIDQSGHVAGDSWAGISLFDHPDNPGYPTAWHCRNDGWAGASFNLNQSYIIKPDEPLTLRYRVLLHNGDAQDGEVARRYEEYICRPSIRIGTPDRV